MGASRRELASSLSMTCRMIPFAGLTRAPSDPSALISALEPWTANAALAELNTVPSSTFATARLFHAIMPKRLQFATVCCSISSRSSLAVRPRRRTSLRWATGTAVRCLSSSCAARFAVDGDQTGTVDAVSRQRTSLL